jgi:hypothetical protein
MDRRAVAYKNVEDFFETSTDIVYDLETPAKFMLDAPNLFSAHAAELADALVSGVDLDVGRYEALWQAKKLLLLTARVNGAMIGYFILKLGQHTRDKKLLAAYEEALYVKPEYRNGVGRKLVKLGLVAAKTAGAELMFVSSPTKAKSLGKMLEYLGFEKSSENFMFDLRS